MTRRTKLDVEIVVETNGSEDNHERAVAWSTNQILNAHRYVHAGEFIAVRVKEGVRQRGMVGHGAPHGDTNEIVEDIFDMTEGATG